MIGLFRIMGQITTRDCAYPQAAGAIQLVPPWYKYLPTQETVANGIADRCAPVFHVDQAADYVKVLLAIFEIILRIGGIAAVVFVMYGGFLYLTSGGEPEKSRNGRSTIINALLGLAITTSATVIVNVLGRI